jgi:GDP-D-mannose dehydratase
MDWQGKRVFITGISGFAGPYLARSLIEKGAEVFGLTRRKTDGIPSRNVRDRDISGRVTLLEGNLEDFSAITHAVSTATPDVVFHLAAQSYVPRSFTHPLETAQANCMGTANVLEAVRSCHSDPVVIFAGSSEEYGLVISSEHQYRMACERYGVIHPGPEKIPELPISEKNPLRPMSPYAVSKVYGDHLMRNYFHTYGVKAVVSRSFNHEGPGRGLMFVTSVITRQVAAMKAGEINSIRIGNVNPFRDWSHVTDITGGYGLLAEKGTHGDVYNQGTGSTSSVLSYLLLSLEEAGFPVDSICTHDGAKSVDDPTGIDHSRQFGVSFDKTIVDRMILEDSVEYTVEDRGLFISSGERKIRVDFEPDRFRPAEVPILLADVKKIKNIGYCARLGIRDVIREQINYFSDIKNRV